MTILKVLSKACIYGLRALAYIAAQSREGEYVSIRELSERLDISFHFLTKTLQILTQEGLLISYRGPNGGIAFQVAPEEITLAEVVKLLEGEDFFDTCLLGLPGCGVAKPCPVHDFWQETRKAMEGEFNATTIADLGAKVSTGEHRLRE